MQAIGGRKTRFGDRAAARFVGTAKPVSADANRIKRWMEYHAANAVTG
jgi:hypothetical protein